MEKLRQGIVNMVNKQLNVPLSETQNSIHQQHLTSILSDLRTTPDHPPYTWHCKDWIKKGVPLKTQFLSLSRKNTIVFPRTHLTMLKHHLQRMNKKGESLKDDDRQFSLPSDSKNLKEKKEDPQDEVCTKKPKDKHCGRARKGKDDGLDPDTILLKDMRLAKKLKEKKNHGLGRCRKKIKCS